MLSSRAAYNIKPNDIKQIMSAGSTNLYDRESNPDGMISLGVAENRLMHQEITEHINSTLKIRPKSLTYGDGSVGSDELRSNIAKFMNATFRPNHPLVLEHVTVLAGVSSVIDTISFCLAEKGDGILLGRPTYVGFISDMVNRAEVKPVLVSFESSGVDPTSLEAVKCYEDALIEANTNGTPVKALLFCNPHNPFGTLYPTNVIEAYLRLCAKYNIHFISDEVYANSVFSSSDFPHPPQFKSVLSLEIEKYIDPSLVHCLYGMSKDFCSNGIRIGVFVSQNNKTLHAAIRAVSKFAWTSSLADSAWSAILADQEFLDGYFRKLRSKLSQSYEHCITLLKEKDIPYVACYSAPFIWIDLSRFLEFPSIKCERELAWKMIKHGVWFATGEAYRSEKPGWFRLTFAVDSTELEIGFERLTKALKD
ncbi:pyridoxal phosphate-dependent transferase [Xylogone sp. PMI_703]|nr:pyridoxal phosphate-dependent transferase [Xylogone sp. PMI_703]